MKILHLTLKKKYFDLIASGKKIEEYRECNPYWFSRLKNYYTDEFKKFNIIHFKNGYKKDSPFMAIEFLGINRKKSIDIDSDFVDKQKYPLSFGGYKSYYVIKLGEILDRKNILNNQKSHFISKIGGIL